MTHDCSQVERASAIVDHAWAELSRSPYIRQQLGVGDLQIPDISFAEAQRRSAVGSALLERVDAVDPKDLPHDLALSLRLVRFRAKTWAREAQWYWFAVDPLGIGFFGLFLPTAYCGGFLINIVTSSFLTFRFAAPGDAERYLCLLRDYARLIEQFHDRLAGQAERGIRMPKVQVLQARRLLGAFRSAARTNLSVHPTRLTLIPHEAFAVEVEAAISNCVEPAFDRALAGLSADYLAAAPDSVGLSQYAGGAAIYAELVKLHTTLDLSPAEVHERGHHRMAEIEAAMQLIRDELHFKGSGAEFLVHLARDSRWRAGTVEGVKAVFQRYIDRLSPTFHTYFATAPRATFLVEPLPEALEGSMTYGYYDPPRSDRAVGRYLFNAQNLTRQALYHLGSLTYHELMPGHHLHLATQHENGALHPFRKHSLVNAYNEGWAEYAATLAGEIGLYVEPEERYGRLVFDAFLTCRLIVDTGMNCLGWSLEQARDYMREHGGMSESDVLTESIRYSCDIPAQSLAYKLGDTQILAFRERMQHALGQRFTLKGFHAVILGPGALPLPELEWHVEQEIVRMDTALPGGLR